MRLSVRRKVDLPHPDGPIIAVTRRSGTVSDTPRTACTFPNHALRFETVIRSRAGASIPVDFRSGRTNPVRRPGLVAADGAMSAGGETGSKADGEDESDEDEGSGPGEGVPFIIRADPVSVDLERQRRDRLPQ